LRCEAVVFARSTRLAVAPARLEQTRALHLMEGGVESAFLELEGVGAAALGLVQHLVAVHLALAQEAQDQHANRAGEELAVVFHLEPVLSKVSYLVHPS